MSEQTTQCDQCQQRYTLFRRKKQCNLCGQTFCAKCVPKPTSSIIVNKPRACTNCLLITNENTTREQLSTIRVKYLRAYLVHSNSVSYNRIEGCIEKDDLINLIESKKRQIPDDTYVFVETINRTNNQTLNDNAPTATPITTNVETQQETIQNSNEQVTSPSDTPLISSNEPTAETVSNPVPTPRPPSPLPSLVAETTKPDRIALSDLRSIEAIQTLTVRQLRDILIQNFVSTKGCVEKADLTNKVEILYRDKQQQLQSDTNGANGPSDENLCKICMDAHIDCVFLDCGHLCTCIQCGKRLSECPLCRSYIIRVVRVFKS